VRIEERTIQFAQMDRLLTLKTELLSLRKEMGVEEKVSVPIVLGCNQFLIQIIEKNRYWFERLAKVSEIEYDQNAGTNHPELNGALELTL